MATAATVLTSAGPEWDAEVYGALWTASKLASAVKDRANAVRMVFGFRKINAQLSDLFAKLDRDVKAAESGAQKDADETITPQRLHEVAANVDHLARMLESVYECARRAGLTNNSFMVRSLNGIRSHIEPLHDLADWFETAAQQTEVNAIFARAHQEKESGDVYHLSQVD